MIENFSWSFQSQFERTKQWYVIAATVIITAVVVSFLVGAFLLGIVLIVFAGVYLLYDVNIHPEVYVNIDTSGVKINLETYDYTRMSSFHIVKIDNKPMMMRFKTTIKTVGDVNIYIDPAIDLDSLRSFLRTHLTESPEIDMSPIDRLLLGLRL